MMNKIKTILLGAFLIGSAVTFGQNDPHKITVSKDFKKQQSLESKKANTKSVAEKQTKRMVDMLDLTPEQAIKVGNLNQRVQDKIAAIKKSDKSEEKKQEFIEGNKRDRLTVLSSILTAEQFAKYKESL